jgi:UPF0755 protein
MANKKVQGLFSKTLKMIGILFVLMGLLIAGLIGWMYYPINVVQSKKVLISPNMKIFSVAQTLEQSGVSVSPWVFVLAAKISPVGSKLQAGEHVLQGQYHMFSLLQALAKPPVTTEVKILIPEGWTFRQFRNFINNHAELKHDTVAMSDAELLQAVGATETHPEGLFFPDTYRVEKQSSDLALFKRAYQLQQKKLQQYWALRSPSSPLKTPYEALVLASIVEKETGRERDRGLVSAVFNNRLKKGMLLQTDPTVIYGLGAAFDGNLRKRDLVNDTPYNSYTRKGLPPTPIALPGVASLKAALNPDVSDVLYFVARGDGSSQFSTTLSEHNLAVSKYQLKR